MTLRSLVRGEKTPLDSTLGSKLRVEILVESSMLVDVSCFGLDADDKLFDDAHMVFYNQLASSGRGVVLSDFASGKGSFDIDLAALPSGVKKLSFVATVDGAGTMGQIAKARAAVSGQLEFVFGPELLSGEKALMILDLYEKNGQWRANANGQGFDGGLSALLAHFGGQEDTAPAATAPAQAAPAASAPVPARLSLEKRFAEKAPQLLSLAKTATVSLSKNGLERSRARAAIVLDASGSMNGQYKNGRVQEALERVLPLAVHFDDDEELETWAFANKAERLPSASCSNISGYVSGVAGGWKQWMSRLNSAWNNEPEVMRAVIRHFTGLTPPEWKSGFLGFGAKRPEEQRAQKLSAATPVFVIFFSDGGVGQDEHIEFLLRWSSTLPIFWQFVGIGGSGYGALERFDDLQGRFLDNADFFAIDDLRSISEAQLYDRMLGEYPSWQEAAAAAGIIANHRR